MLEYSTTYGEPDSPTVVLLHPAGGTRHVWTPHAEQLQDDYHVISLDLPAHGIHPSATFSFDRAVADIERVLDDVGSAVLVGHSQGGYVAMRAAAEHGDSVDGLLLAGASYEWRRPKMMAFSALYHPVSYVFDAISYSDRLSEWIIERFGEGDDKRQEPPEHEETYETLRGTAQCIRASTFQRAWPYVKAYDGPVMVAHGTEEMLQDHAEELAERVNARLEWFTGDHQAPMDDTHEFTELTRDFLTDVY